MGAIWSLFLLVSCLNIRYLTPKSLTSPKYAWLWITFVALIARLIPNAILPMGAGYDIESFRIAGNLVLQRQDVYASPLAIDRHPYLPLQMYWMAAAVWIADNLNLSFVTVYRLLPIFADLGVALLLFQILRAKDHQGAVYGALWYALCPIPVLISAYHGQFDALPILLILAALYYLGRKSWLIGIWLGFAILAKSWPVLTLPSLLQV
jgi:Gpi18-like mannosyltransferase